MLRMTDRLIQPNDTALFMSRDHKRYLIRLLVDGELHTHRGIIKHNDCIGGVWGREMKTHLGYPFLLLDPSTADLIQDIKRTTQIIFPKDVGYILLKLSIHPGVTVLEAGTGSGGLTLALARAALPGGHVISYEVRPDMQNLARKNLERVGLLEQVEFKLKDIAEGFDEDGVDAVFLDVPEPANYLGVASRALRSGGFFGTLVPTTNQISRLLDRISAYPFGLIEVEELMLRGYKTVPERLRPLDRMIGHTGYLLFARKFERAIIEDDSIVIEGDAEAEQPE
ncbi:tRNA (adenine(58)-N(1))-methyltransferase TrmI [Thermoflexales bacterium]|nr:tRNA (adenine(58)-N(1))-methyltransferase TrmI [Thermoflexales bacterium]